MRRALVLAVLLFGCGSRTTGNSTNGSASATASAAPAPTPDPARRAAAKKLRNALESPAVDPSQRARIAAMGLSEQRFGLRKGILKALGACAGESIDPSQCARILGQGLETSEKEAVSKRCGIDLESLRKKIYDLPEPEKTPALISTCKVTLPKDKDPTKLNPWAVLTSAALSDELAADPLSNDDEKYLVAILIELQAVTDTTGGSGSSHVEPSPR